MCTPNNSSFQTKHSKIFDYGETTLYACQYDQRFSYFAYTPKNFQQGSKQEHPIIVAIHGTERSAQSYRDALIPLADSLDAIIVAPLFPSGIIEPNDMDNYKFIKFHNIRFDEVLLAMIDEITIKYELPNKKFYLHGFSGGGQFTHRFFYLHPDRLLGLSIGAPGRITYLDSNIPWYEGIADIEVQFGKKVNFEELKNVPVQMIVGEDDIEDLGKTRYGKNRVERLKALQRNYEEHGITVQLDTVPATQHEGMKLLPDVEVFFKSLI
ncbi:hypothetical protein [Vreelandella sp. EE27]